MNLRGEKYLAPDHGSGTPAGAVSSGKPAFTRPGLQGPLARAAAATAAAAAAQKAQQQQAGREGSSRGAQRVAVPAATTGAVSVAHHNHCCRKQIQWATICGGDSSVPTLFWP